jgi:hypothetical protein
MSKPKSLALRTSGWPPLRPSARPVGTLDPRPSEHPAVITGRKAGFRSHVRRYYASVSYQEQSWKKLRRLVAKVEWHPGELYPRVGCIVTNPWRGRPSAWWPSTSAPRQSSGSNKGRPRSGGRACHVVPSLPTLHAEPWRCPRQRSSGPCEFAGEADQDRRQGHLVMAATSCSRWPRPRCRDRCSPTSCG